MLYVNEFTEITDIEGEVPKPGLYVLVAQYYQPDKAEFEIPMNITYANPGEEMNVTTLIENGQFYEAVLPLPTCRSNSGCRTVIQPKDKTAQPEPSFNLNDGFHIHSEVSLYIIVRWIMEFLTLGLKISLILSMKRWASRRWFCFVF